MKQILELIENVDPSDTDTLDEIDARLHCLVNGREFFEVHDGSRYFYFKPAGETKTFDDNRAISLAPKYTRSRDALKSIRPEGWRFFVHNMDDYRRKLVYACLSHNSNTSIDGYQLPTEELAELHAIISAIQWERDNENT